MSVLPLQGLRVIDHGVVWTGPLLGRVLGDHGAQVLWVRPPQRLLGMTITGTPTPFTDPTNPRSYQPYGRSKLCVTIDLHHSKGKELYKELARVSDIVVENFAPRTMPGLGLSYDALKAVNPRLIMLSMPAAGSTPGPWRDLMTYGPSLSALFGLKSHLGYPGERVLDDTADLDPTACMQGFFVLMAALYERQRSGLGQWIDMSQGEACMQRNAEAIMDYTMNGRVWGTLGNRYPGMAPHDTYRCRGDDQWVAIAIKADEDWTAFCQVMGHPIWANDPHFGDAQQRTNNIDELDRMVESWTMRHTKEEVQELLQAAGVAAHAVLDAAEIFADENYTALRTNVKVEVDGISPEMIFTGLPWKYQKTPLSIRGNQGAPDRDNDFVFGEVLGLSRTEQDRLREDNII